MVAQKGRDLLLKVEDGGSFVTVAGLRSKKLSFNAQAVDVTDAQSAGRWRELLGGTGVQRASVSGSGIFKETSPQHWRLSGLLRGLAGSEDAMAEGHEAGAVAVLLDAAVRPLGLSADEAGRSLNWIAETRGVTEAATPIVFAGGMRARTPIAPVHLNGRRLPSGAIRFSWTRRGRLNADSWEGYDIPSMNLSKPIALKSLPERRSRDRSRSIRLTSNTRKLPKSLISAARSHTSSSASGSSVVRSARGSRRRKW